MSELSLEKRIENLKGQQEQTKDLFWKCQGAIELLESMIKENKEKQDKSSKKEDKK